MGMTTGWKIFFGLILLSIVAYLYFGDKYEDPILTTNPDNSTSLTCEGKDWKQIPDPDNQSQPICYKESGLGHVKLTFLQVLAMALSLGTGFVFYVEFLRRERSSVLIYFEDPYQKENKPTTICPDIGQSDGYIWTCKGFNEIVIGYDDELHVARREMVSRISKNLIIRGEKQRVTPQMLYSYLGNNPVLFKYITKRTIADLKRSKIIENTSDWPVIYVPKELPYEHLKNFRSLKGNYAFGANRFGVIISLLFKMQRSIDSLDIKMHDTLKNMMKHGEDYTSSTSRIGREADRTRKTETADRSRTSPQEDMRREA